MNDRVQLDPDSLRQDSARLAELGDQVGRTYTGLQGALADADGCWGDDDLGESFASNFTPAADQLLTDLRAMAESLRATAKQAAAAAHDFEAQDRRSADLVARAADDSHRPDPTNGLSTQPMPATAPPAAQPPTTSSPVPRPTTADRPATEQSAPGGPPGSAPGGPSTSQNNPQSSNPAAGPPNQQSRTGNPESPSRRPRAPQVAPPATAMRDVSRIPSTPSSPPGALPPPRVSAPPAAGRRETPWTGDPPRTNRAATAAAAEPNSTPPRPGPPRPPKADEPRKRDERRDTEQPSETASVLAWLARTLADRHDVVVVGFDLPDLQEAPVRAFAAAIDRVLTEYPAIELDLVAVADLEAGTDGVQWQSASRDLAAVRSITLDRQVAGEPIRDIEASETETGPEDSAVYSATVRELGLALDSAGGGVARRTAQHTLIAEYMRVVAGQYTTLGELVRGYRRWRAELTGTAGGFDVDRAVGVAFADVVRHGERARAAAKTLHAALVDAAPPPG